MNTKHISWILVTALFLLSVPLSAQNVGINGTGASPDASAMLDISSTTGGLLVPRMTTAQRNVIPAPATGLLVYDLTTLGFWQYDGTQWVELLSGSDDDWVRGTPNALHNASDSIAIGRAVPYADLHMASGKNVLIGDSLSGSGSKMIYYGAKGAFRCGYLSNPFGGYNYHRFWDNDSVGYYSWAGGQNSRAKGFGSFAFGSFGWADGSSSVAFFGNARGNGSVSFHGNSEGRDSFTFNGTADDEGGIAMFGYTGGRYGVAIGGGSTGLGASSSREDYAVAIGWNADARGQASIALGPSDAYGYNSFSTGWVTEARGNYSSTFGYRTNSYAYGSMALGRYNLVQGDSAAWISNDPVFQIGDGTSNTNRSNSFTILKNGRTAVGYNYPTGMLNVSSALGSLGTTLNTNAAAILIGSTTNGMAFDANQIESVGDELFLNYASTFDVISNIGGGRFGIGTAAPTDRLQVDALTGENALRVRVAGTTRLRVHANGGVSVGANQLPPAAGLYVTGESRFDGDVMPDNNNLYSLGTATLRWTAVHATNGIIQTSDRRLKTGIAPLEAGLEAVLQLRPVTFYWKEEDNGRRIGLIAQEVRTVLPEVVSVADDAPGTLGMNYAELVPVLIKALQEQEVRIASLEKRISALER